VPFDPSKSVSYTQNLRGPKDLFVTERDIIFKKEEDLEPEEGKKKKKKVEEPLKMYPEHKYGFASIGRGKDTDNVMMYQTNKETEDATLLASKAISLSYFTRPGTSEQNSGQALLSLKQKLTAREQIT